MSREKFHIVLIRPTHYDDDGYPIQWRRSAIPSNSLACVFGIVDEALQRKVLGDNVDSIITAVDEANTRIRPDRLIQQIRSDGGKALICMVGVQTNQFPRSIDLAKPFVEAGLPVAIGGFHISGCLAMLDTVPDEITQAQAMGISLFAGEAEERRMDEVLQDAYNGKLKPIYDYLKSMPDLRSQAMPFLPAGKVGRTYQRFSSFDLGRGCPFECSFCTIINVQGRVSRFRTADDLEAIVRANIANGIDSFFITDDNLARNKNWEDCFDRLIELRQQHGIVLKLQIQVDTLCHRIEGFIDKAAAAGATRIFIGMENINPDNLKEAKKRQNKITEYREMLLAWKKHSVIITAGYILGFSGDTRESILRDIDIIKRELPIDIMFFTFLTPLPGSADHKNLLSQKIWMDSDLNKFDLNHRVTHHNTMTDEEWDRVYDEAWERYYSMDHLETILRRAAALGSNLKHNTVISLIWYREFRRLFNIHPLEGGLIRLKYRRDRRPGMPLENPLVFYPKYLAELIYKNLSMYRNYAHLMRAMRKIWADPKRKDYIDLAITPPQASDYQSLEMFATDAAKIAVKKESRRKQIPVTQL